MNRFGFHWCWLDRECREYDAPNRIHVFVPGWVLIIGIGWSNRTQGWLPGRGYLDSWWPIVVHPRGKREI